MKLHYISKIYHSENLIVMENYLNELRLLSMLIENRFKQRHLIHQREGRKGNLLKMLNDKWLQLDFEIRLMKNEILDENGELIYLQMMIQKD